MLEEGVFFGWGRNGRWEDADVVFVARWIDCSMFEQGSVVSVNVMTTY
jgi:hypothetical protein